MCLLKLISLNLNQLKATFYSLLLEKNAILCALLLENVAPISTSPLKQWKGLRLLFRKLERQQDEAIIRHAPNSQRPVSNYLFCLFLQRLKYWTSITNYIEWVIYVSALVFVFPICACKSHYKPEAAAFSLFFAWLNLVLYFRR